MKYLILLSFLFIGCQTPRVSEFYGPCLELGRVCELYSASDVYKLCPYGKGCYAFTQFTCTLSYKDIKVLETSSTEEMERIQNVCSAVILKQNVEFLKELKGIK